MERTKSDKKVFSNQEFQVPDKNSNLNLNQSYKNVDIKANNCYSTPKTYHNFGK